MSTNRCSSGARVVAATSIAFMLSAAVVQQQLPPTGTESRRTFGPLTVTTIAEGLDHPWSIAFLPDGAMLVTERVGRLRVIRNGQLDPNPIEGVPKVFTAPFAGLMDVVLHPGFAKNQFVYLSYNKEGPALPANAPRMGARMIKPAQSGGLKKGVQYTVTMAIARGRWTGSALTEVRDIFIADDWKDETVSAFSPARMVFGRDGMLYVTNGGPSAPASEGPHARTVGGVAQDPMRDGGKVLRLRDDGTIPPDNPFVGRTGYKPEIFSLGHRTPLGLAVHPTTGAIFETENGPADGDEINILKAGANYGYPLVGMGRDYSGDFIGGAGMVGEPVGRQDAYKMYMEGMEQPYIFWAPTVAPSGMMFYTGTRFPGWTNSLLVGTLKAQRLERYAINEKGWVGRREYLLEGMNRRIRDVRQGPDELIYLLTDEDRGAVLKVERTNQAK